MNSLNVEDLPEGWTSARVDDVCDVNPRLNKSEISDDLLVSFVPMPAVGAGNGSIDVSQERPVSEVKKGFITFKQGDVLFAKITPCMENGKMAIVPKVINGYGFGSTEFHVLRPKEGADARYVYYYVSSQNFRGVAERYMTGAVGQKRVSTTYLKEQKIPLAPPEQQKSIVTEIEKQFSRLDEAVANLKRVKANLKRYKAAVLKAAVEGKLTEKWRKSRVGVGSPRPGRGDRAPTEPIETGSELLQRILVERREKWQGRGKYKEPVAPDTSGLPELPEGWVWASVEQLSVLVQYGSSAKTSEDTSGVPVLRMGNIVDGTLCFEELKYLPKKHDEFPSLFLQPSDLLFNRTNSPELVGKTAVFNGFKTPCSYASYLIRVRLLKSYLSPLLSHYINSSYGRHWVKAVVTQQVGQANVNGTKLKALAVPVPPHAEQQQILAETERRLSIVGETEAQIGANLRRAGRLRQSILNKAFSGEL